MCNLLKKFCFRTGSVKGDPTLKDQKNDFKSTHFEIPSIKNPMEDSDLQPRLIMHHGMPMTCSVIAYDPLQHTLALATQDGRIKVFISTGSEILLQSSKVSLIHLLQFFNNQAMLVSVNGENDIEVWNIGTGELLCSRKWENGVTALAVIQYSNFLYGFFFSFVENCFWRYMAAKRKLSFPINITVLRYIGDKTGTVTAAQYDHKQKELNVVPYILSLSQILGDFIENYDEKSVIQVLPQPSAEYEKVLLCYANGICILWALHDGQVLAVRTHTQSQIETIIEAEKGQTNTPNLSSENNVITDEDDVRNLMSVCWCCPKGTMFATGYTNGDIWLWSIPSKLKTIDRENNHTKFSSSPLCKLNGGSMIHISTLRWLEDSGGKLEKNGYLCALGGKSFSACDMLKVVSLKSKSSVELIVPADLADISVIDTPSKVQVIAAAAKSYHSLYTYNLKDIYRSFKEVSTVKPVSVASPLLESRITAARTILLNRNGSVANHLLEVPRVLSSYLGYQSSDVDEKCLLNCYNNAEFSTNSRDKGCYLYVTGHENGSVHLWDISSQVSLIKIQENNGSKGPSLAEVEVCSLDFCYASGFLAIGYKNGLISLYKLYFEDGDTITKGNWRFVSNFCKQEVPISCILISSPCKCIAAGSECGIISLIHLETNALLFNGRCHPNMTSEIISFNFVSLSTRITLPCSASPSTTRSEQQQLNVQTENLLIVTTKDPQIFILDAKSGGCCSTSPLKPKTQSKAISLHILDTAGDFLIMASGHRCQLIPETDSFQEPQNLSTELSKCLILLCTEDTLRVYHLSSLLKGICSSSIKTSLNGSCSWASTFQTPTNKTGLVLMYQSHLIEVRGFPKLDVLKSFSLENVFNWKMELNLGLFRTTSCSGNGQMTLVHDDNELLFLSLVDAKHDIRFSALALPGVSENSTNIELEKKKTSFGKRVKSNVFLKTRDKANESRYRKILELEELFVGSSSSHQFSFNSNDDSRSYEIDSNDLDIDDIVIEDADGATSSNHSNLIKKFKKKIKINKGDKKDKQRNQAENEAQNDLPIGHGARTIDEIKATYGQGREQNVTGTAAATRDKLLEQRQKLQTIDKRTAEMQEEAESFEHLAKELVKTIQEKNKRMF